MPFFDSFASTRRNAPPLERKIKPNVRVPLCRFSFSFSFSLFLVFSLVFTCRGFFSLWRSFNLLQSSSIRCSLSLSLSLSLLLVRSFHSSDSENERIHGRHFLDPLDWHPRYFVPFCHRKASGVRGADWWDVAPTSEQERKRNEKKKRRKMRRNVTKPAIKKKKEKKNRGTPTVVLGVRQ